MIEVSVRGIGFWSPGVADWTQARALIAGGESWPAPTATRPAPALMPANERRRAPDSVLLALAVAEQACVQANVDRATIVSVFASTYGDLVINDYMCATLADDPTLLSPTKFHNSVHNAPSGYWSIATGAMSPTTAIAGFRETFAAGLFEACTQLHESEAPVLLVAYDVAGAGPMADIARCTQPFGCALLLDGGLGDAASARLTVRIDDAPASPTRPASTGLIELAAANPIALGAGALLEALALGGEQAIELPFALGQRLALQVAA